MSEHFLRGTSRVVAGTILLAALGARQGKVEGRGAARRFLSQKYGFSMAVPTGWVVSSQLDTPAFENAFSIDQRLQHSVAIYWEFEGELFVAHLNYNAGDPDGPRLEEVFLQV